MSSPSPVELADRVSRRRAILVAVAAIMFLGIHLALRPFFYARFQPRADACIDWWAVNAGVLLAALATGGGILNRRAIRELVNDEVSRSHYRTAVHAGFWTAMGGGMALYLVPAFDGLGAHDVLYLLVTCALGLALLTFAALELRAHRDG